MSVCVRLGACTTSKPAELRNPGDRLGVVYGFGSADTEVIGVADDERDPVLGQRAADTDQQVEAKAASFTRKRNDMVRASTCSAAYRAATRRASATLMTVPVIGGRFMAGVGPGLRGPR